MDQIILEKGAPLPFFFNILFREAFLQTSFCLWVVRNLQPFELFYYFI
jgi:hypothetical protein